MSDQPWFFTVEDRRAGNRYYPLSGLARTKGMPGNVPWSLSARQAMWFESWAEAEKWRLRHCPARGQVVPIRVEFGEPQPRPPLDPTSMEGRFAAALDAGPDAVHRQPPTDVE